MEGWGLTEVTGIFFSSVIMINSYNVNGKEKLDSVRVSKYRDARYGTAAMALASFSARMICCFPKRSCPMCNADFSSEISGKFFKI